MVAPAATLNHEIELFAQIMLRGLILIKMLPAWTTLLQQSHGLSGAASGDLKVKSWSSDKASRSGGPNNRRASLGKINRLHCQMNFSALDRARSPRNAAPFRRARQCQCPISDII